MTETWQPVPGFEWVYEVSDLGRVRSLDRVVARSDGRTQRHRGAILVARTRQHDPRPEVRLTADGKRTPRRVARLVLTAFVGPCPPGLEACHRNGDETDNRLTNLRWDTRSSNALDRVAHGRDNHARRTHCPRGHRLQGPNLSPAHLRRGQRNCLACNRASADVCKAKNKGVVLDYQQVADRHYARIAVAA